MSKWLGQVVQDLEKHPLVALARWVHGREPSKDSGRMAGWVGCMVADVVKELRDGAERLPDDRLLKHLCDTMSYEHGATVSDGNVEIPEAWKRAWDDIRAMRAEISSLCSTLEQMDRGRCRLATRVRTTTAERRRNGQMKLPGLVRMKHFEDGTAATLLEPTEAYGTDHQHGDAGLGT